MENKQTAVDWLVQQYTQGNYSWEAYIQAKQMEKEQIMNAYNHNMTGFDKLEQEEIGLNWSEDYYNETYGAFS